MTDSMIEPQHPSQVQISPEVPDVWFSSPPDEEALKEAPHSAGIHIVFTSPPREAR
ncbi:hypothetical protein [Actinoplanes sp. GCM10030250]|uniref:hypothetical protein n=1 Tax=Actinoplanes sp. GCM10030250 TaxID=3273376 RepID=UPI00360F7602